MKRIREGSYALSGELDMDSAHVLASAVDPHASVPYLELDLSGLTLLDSVGLQALLGLARALPGTLVLSGARGSVAGVLTRTGIDQHRNIHLRSGS